LRRHRRLLTNPGLQAVDSSSVGTAYPALPFKATVDRFLALPFHDVVRPKLLYENAQRLFEGGTP
jgi:hypothetical protein